MGKLTTVQEAWLRERFNDRVSIDLLERKIYSHDVGVIPPLVKPLVGKSLADAVVQPKNEKEIVALARWANQNRIPLVPRGKATSCYGGFLPIKGGVTLDFWHMRRILSVDAERLTVTVEPGLVWRELEQELFKQELALRLYPSSAPSSTVGGWLAQGGFGYGSFEYGSFSENVVSARVVLPNGEVREFSDDELELVADAEGITGIITQVTFKIRLLEEEVVMGACFAKVGHLASALRKIVAEGMPLWSISFINPAMACLKNRCPTKLKQGHPADVQRPEIPEAYMVIFVFPAIHDHRSQVQESLARIVVHNGGYCVDSDLAAYGWKERFSILHIRRLGPSVIPTQFVLTLENLDRALADIERSIHQPMVIEGMVVQGQNGTGKIPQVILQGFIPHDERTFTYNVAFGLSLSAIKKAKQYGGRPYASGLYFAREAENILGVERVRRLRTFKQKVDPYGVMNPGKILDGNLLGTFMDMVNVFEPIVRPLANLAKTPVGERIKGSGRRGIPDDVAWYAYTCAQCGYCVNSCGQFYGRGWESQSPRGKWFLLREYMAGRNGKMTQEQVDTFLSCTTCEICNVECPLELPIERCWLKMRGKLIHEDDRLTFPPFEIMRASLRKEHNIWGGHRRHRGDWAQTGKITVHEKAEISYFPGCTASYVEQDIAQSTAYLLGKAGVAFTCLGADEACCGMPMLLAGLWDTWKEIMLHNITAMKMRGVKTIITSCPACWLVWKQYYPEWAAKLGMDYPFKVRHYSEVLAERIRSGDLVFDQPVNMRVTWKDSCHIGRSGGVYEAPREVLQAIPGLEFVEMEHNREDSYCCGSVVSLVADPEAAKRIGEVCLREADDVAASAIATCCPCCQIQLRVTAQKTGRDLSIIDLSTLACKASGIPHPDLTESTLKMWGTFEALINLMKPEAMANMMAELFPQMMKAMPLGTGSMLRATGRMGPVGDVVLRIVKPIFPVLFSLLMPGMMHQMVPHILVAIERQVPMPAHMKEQMPGLMPAAMDNLIPKMLPSIMPLLSDRLIAYLQNGSR